MGTFVENVKKSPKSTHPIKELCTTLIVDSWQHCWQVIQVIYMIELVNSVSTCAVK
jgi:hypothetical protein